MLSRRRFFGQAALGFGTLPLMQLLGREGAIAGDPPLARPANDNPLAPRAPHFTPKAKRVIYLFMHGGPSHVDTFDPKPLLTRYHDQAPPASFHNLQFQFIDIRRQKLMASQQTFRKCGRSGIEICDTMPHLQSRADDLTVLRGCHHEIFNHTPGIWLLNTGHERLGRPSLGSWVTYGLGSEADNLPAFVVMTDGPLKPGPGVWANGFLPALYQGTRLADGVNPIPNLRRPPELDGLDQRAVLDFTQSLNRNHLAERPGDTELEARIASYELAFRMQAAAPETVDLSRETQETRDLYGPGFGERCLIARRLVERGVRFVQIYHGCGPGGWDTHTSNHAGQSNLMRQTDRGAAALLADLKRRGLLDDTLVLWGGEFGRTPTTEGNNGRDHSPYGYSMFLAGAGLKPGICYGATDDFGFQAVTGKIHAHDLNATILHLLGLDHERLTYRHAGRDFRLTDVFGNVVRAILA